MKVSYDALRQAVSVNRSRPGSLRFHRCFVKLIIASKAMHKMSPSKSRATRVHGLPSATPFVRKYNISRRMTCPYASPEGGHDLLFRELNYPAEMQAGSNITSFVLTVYRLYFKPGEQSFRFNNDEKLRRYEEVDIGSTVQDWNTSTSPNVDGMRTSPKPYANQCIHH